jgi:hypothetical protein
MILSALSLNASLLAEVSLEFEGWNTGGLVALLLVGLAGYVFHTQMNAADRRRAKPRDPALIVLAPVEEAKPNTRKRTLFHAPLAVPAADQGGKRKDKRRTGNPVDVRLTDAAGKQPYEAVVIDRSRGGLCILSDRSARVGQILKVRAIHAPENVDWLPIEVRHCKQRDGKYRFGCAFKEKPPWSVVLLFG